MGLYIIKTDKGLELVDDKCNILASEPINAALTTDALGHEHDELGHFTSSDMARLASKGAWGVSHVLHGFAGKDEDTSEYLRPAKEGLNNSAAALKAANQKDSSLAAEYHNEAARAHEDAAEGHRGYSGADIRHEEAAGLHDEAAQMHWAAVKTHRQLITAMGES